MGTAVLRYQDCLPDRFYHETQALNQHFRPRRNPNTVNSSNSNPKTNQSCRRKGSPVTMHSNQLDPSRANQMDRFKKVPMKNLVMGEVRILKRGEKLSHENDMENRKARAKSEGDCDLVLRSTVRLGPDPEMVQKVIKVTEFKVGDGGYAGSAFVTSPPPTSLPVPGFLGKNGVATSDLRRLLRLDF